ncbi:amino acid adenylation domain-containing protein [Actinoplanes sp. RD1]|uniref:amino acid adenylation domain-containing protein n=1 Tax=Actinoplanes sp. RD1 TaxID=3064538 RepID=UPI002740718E|nr:amino acid adenylation domain-containing protein [Actinoplanes sp. RD1]
MTAAQQALWFAQQLDPASPAFWCAHRIDLDGPLDVNRLAAAVAEVSAETEMLCARFLTEGTDVFWTPGAAPPVELLDLPDENAVEQWIRADLATVPELTGAGLVRLALLRLGPDRTVWYLRAHHLLLDGFAFSLVIDRVVAAYQGRDSAPWKPLRALLTAEDAYRGSDAYAADRQFWLDRLAGAPPPAALAEATAGPAHERARRHREVPGDVLRSVADRLGVTWAETAIAVGALYLHRLTGARDVTLGLPVAGRLGTPAARIPATVVNVLPLRLVVPAGSTLRQLAVTVQAEVRAAVRHQRYRYEWLQRDLGLVGTGRRLVGPQVNVKPFRRDLDLGAGVTGRVHYLATGPADDFELTVGMDTGSGRLDVTVDANPRLYPPEQLDAHFERLAGLLQAQLGPDDLVEEVEVRTPTEISRTRRWNATTRPVPDTTLTELLDARADSAAPAVRSGGAELSYAELHERAGRLARWLAARGAGPGTLVAVALPRSLDLVVALLGILKSGAGYLPLDASYPPDRLAFMIEDAQPVCVLEEMPDLTHVPDHPLAVARPGDTAYAIYTSGSTGRPKGVLVPHRGIVNRLLWMQGRYGLRPGERVLQKTPSGFDVSVWEFFWPLLAGGTLVLARPDGHKDPAYLASLIVEEHVSTAHFVPSMLRVFLSEPAAGKTAGVLRRVICSGEELSEDLARLFPQVVGAELHNLYGPTEASVDVTAWECAAGDPPGPVPIGRPVWNTRLHVLDTRLEPVPVGVTGELYLDGVQLATGYLGRPGLTASRFVAAADGTRMYRTGDLARFRADGAVEYRGRADDQVKIRGFRVELGEIEAVLTEHPGVRRAAVAHLDGRLCAYVVGSPDVTGWLRSRLPEHMVPSVVLPVDELPLTPSGKLDRRALPAPPVTVGGDAPRTATERLVASTIADVLGVAVPGPDDNFFALGGHSLLAATLVQRLRAATGTAVPLAAVFAAPTVAGLAARLSTGADAGEGLRTLLPLRPSPDGPALFCVHPAGGLAWCYAGLLPHLDPSIAVYGLQSRSLLSPGPASTLAAVAADYVREIRRVRPHGPYALAGWSVGGVIAQAAAAQLRRAGHEVSVLALLDAYPADQWRDLPAPTTGDALRALLTMAGLDDEPGPVTADGVVARLRASGGPMADLDPALLAVVPSVVAGNARMMREHHHEAFDGPAILYAAGAPRAEDWLDPEGWRPYVGSLEVRTLDCTHPGLVRPAALRVIGRDLTRLLVR